MPLSADHLSEPDFEFCEPREASGEARFTLESLPPAVVERDLDPAVLTLLEPGQSLVIRLAASPVGRIAAGLCLSGTSGPQDSMAALTALFPAARLVEEPASAADEADHLVTLVPEPRMLRHADRPVALPHDPGLWPWRIDAAMDLLARHDAQLAIAVVAPWCEQATRKLAEQLVEQIRLAELRLPVSPLTDHFGRLALAIQTLPGLVEIRLQCSSHLPGPARELLSVLLCGTRPIRDPGSVCGVLCLPRRLPARLFPRREPQFADPASDAGALPFAQSATGAMMSIDASARMRHLYVMGGTGTGKSTLMRRLLESDMKRGEGVLLIDPHGDLAAEVIAAVPDARRDELVIADAGAGSLLLPLMPRSADALDIERAIDGLVSLFMDVLYDFNHDAFGPVFEQFFRNAMLLLALAPPAERQLTNLPRVFEEPSYRRALLADCPDAACHAFWTRTAERMNGEWSIGNMTAYITSKLNRLIGGAAARRIFAAKEAPLDLRTAMDQGRIVIVSAAKGVLGEGLSRTVVAALLMRLRMAAMARTGQSRDRRRPFRVYLDEFQGARGSELAMLLAEGRKYGLSFTLANQSLRQLGGSAPGTLGAAVLANAANLALFRLGGPDAQDVTPWLGGSVPWQSLCSQPDFRFTARLLERGQPRLVRNLGTAPGAMA